MDQAPVAKHMRELHYYAGASTMSLSACSVETQLLA